MNIHNLWAFTKFTTGLSENQYIENVPTLPSSEKHGGDPKANADKGMETSSIVKTARMFFPFFLRACVPAFLTNGQLLQICLFLLNFPGIRGQYGTV